MSGGEKQRLSIARAILKKSKIILLDEATSSLDSISENAIKIAIDNISGNKTILVIAHRLSTVKDADKIIVMNSGRVVENGTHEDLIEKRGLYFDMWNDQSKSE